MQRSPGRTTTAATLCAESGSWELVELEVDPPRPGEVLVRPNEMSDLRSWHARCSSHWGRWRRGQLNLADSITSRHAREDISQGYQDLDDGKNIRGIIEHGR